jgi:hypothetical protein
MERYFPELILFKVHGSRDFVCRIGLCGYIQVKELCGGIAEAD